MRKKIILFVFTLILSFTFLDNLYAKETTICQYKYDNDNVTETITVQIVDGVLQEDASYLKEESNKNDSEVKLSVSNGQHPLYGTKFTVDEYYKNNKKCPKVAFFVKMTGTRYIYLSDEANEGNMSNILEDKYPKDFKKFSQTGSKEQIEQEENNKNTLSSSCMSFKDPKPCKLGYTDPNAEIKFSCLWVTNEFDTDGYCNVDNLVYVKCGDTFDIPHQAPKIISFVVYLLKIGTPIILIFFSIIPLVKAITKSNEDELKKAQKILVKKLIAGALVFFVVSIVQFVIMKVADSTETGNISKCFDCFLNNNCKDSAYYKTNVGGTYLCKNFSGGDAYSCEGNK